MGAVNGSGKRLGWWMPVLTLGLTLGILLGRAGKVLWPMAAALVCTVAALVLMRGQMRQLVAVGLLAACLGTAMGYAAWHSPLPEAETCQVTGVVCEEITRKDNGQVRTRLTDVTLNGEAAGDAYWSFYLADGEEELPEGMTPGCGVTLTASVYHPSEAENPGGFNFREYLLAQGITYGLYGREELQCAPAAAFSLKGSLAALRHTLSLRMIAAMGEEAGAYATAMLLGSKSLLPAEDLSDFSRLGIAHILTVSGFHVGLLAGILLLLLRRASGKTRLVCVTLVLLFYCLLTGGHSPVIRATVFTLLMLYGRLRHRPVNGLWLLCAAWCITLAMNPAQLVSAGFLMSFGAVAGLLIAGPALQCLLKPKTRPGRWLWEGFTASVAAQLGLLVPLLYFYQEVPLIGIFLNVFVIAGASVLIPVYYLGLLLCSVPVAGEWIGAVGRWMTAGMTAAVHWLGDLPAFALWTKQSDLLTLAGWVVTMTGLSLALPLKKQLRAALLSGGLLVMCLSLIPLPHSGTEYLQLSVGSADSAVLWDENTVTVVDTGEDGEALSTWLHQRRLSVDSLILTHLHSDHAGGLQALLDDRIPVKTVYVPAGWDTMETDAGMPELMQQLLDTGTELRVLYRGCELALPSGSMTVLWPLQEGLRSGSDPNEGSLAMLAELHGTTLLLTGDLDGTYERYAAVPADLLKAAHHGSKSSTGEEFLATVAPQAILLSGGDTARLESLQERAGSIPVYGTQEKGALQVDITDAGYSISFMRE